MEVVIFRVQGILNGQLSPGHFSMLLTTVLVVVSLFLHGTVGGDSDCHDVHWFTRSQDLCDELCLRLLFFLRSFSAYSCSHRKRIQRKG